MPTFQTTDTMYTHLNGQEIEIDGIINTPDDDHDAEVLPMYQISFSGDVHIEAWADEIILADEVCPQCGESNPYLDGSDHRYRICNCCNLSYSEVYWVCPDCKAINTDIKGLTVLPVCGDCGEHFEWDLIGE